LSAPVRIAAWRTLIERAVQTSPQVVELISPPERVPFRTLYERHFAFGWRTLRYLGVPERLLDDAAQEMWVVVHRRYGEFEGRSDVKTWLFAIAINVERNIRRTERRRGTQVPLPAELCANGKDPLLAREEKEAWALILGFVNTLDETRRAVFAANLVEGLSAAETALITGLPLDTVYHRVRALRRSFNAWAEQHRREP
jgi:RNA polymerase sigma-70 factor, ECF subfamily